MRSEFKDKGIGTPADWQIGIMLGRLSSPINGKIQAFPKLTWQKEFGIAREIGFDAIEFIFDGRDNPLFNDAGLSEIEHLAKENQILISSVCSDYSMYNPLYGKTSESTTAIIKELIKRCGKIGIPRVGVSFEDNSAIIDEAQSSEAAANLREIMKVAEKMNVILTMETSLAVKNVKELIKRVGSNHLKVNFDLGNSCCLGEDTPSVIRELGGLIGGVHIKDRTRLFGRTVPLGTGDVDFKACFDALRDINYKGVLIIQAARGEDDVQTAKNYLEFIKRYL